MYPTIAALNGTTDPTQYLVYGNLVTNGAFGPLILAAFFLILFIGGGYAQIRFTGRLKPASAFTVAAFSTFGMATIMSIEPGLLNSGYVILCVAASVLGVAWLYISSESPNL